MFTCTYYYMSVKSTKLINCLKDQKIRLAKADSDYYYVYIFSLFSRFPKMR